MSSTWIWRVFFLSLSHVQIALYILQPLFSWSMFFSNPTRCRASHIKLRFTFCRRDSLRDNAWHGYRLQNTSTGDYANSSYSFSSCTVHTHIHRIRCDTVCDGLVWFILTRTQIFDYIFLRNWSDVPSSSQSTRTQQTHCQTENIEWELPNRTNVVRVLFQCCDSIVRARIAYWADAN